MLNDSYQSMAANAKLDRKWIEASQRIATLEEQNAELVAAQTKVIHRLQMDIDDGGRPDQWSMESMVETLRNAAKVKQS